MLTWLVTVFIDSASLRENIVSLAKNIGYLPVQGKQHVHLVSFSLIRLN